jgi:alpha-tubulin suppressor-like RCC1 family protein
MALTQIHFKAMGTKAITKVAAGLFRVIVLFQNGTLLSFGRGSNGELGIGVQIITGIPQNIAYFVDNEPVIDVQAGSEHSVFLLEDGDLYSCGNNQEGAAGLGNLEIALFPTKINIPEPIRSIWVVVPCFRPIHGGTNVCLGKERVRSTWN